MKLSAYLDALEIELKLVALEGFFYSKVGGDVEDVENLFAEFCLDASVLLFFCALDNLMLDQPN